MTNKEYIAVIDELIPDIMSQVVLSGRYIGKTLKDVYDELTEEQKTFVYNWVGQVLEQPDRYNYELPYDHELPSDWEREVWASMTNEQREATYLIIAMARCNAINEKEKKK